MTQSYQPDFDKLIQGQSNETSEAEIMAEIRKVMVAETVVHPEIVRPQVRNPKPTTPVEPQHPASTETVVTKTIARKMMSYQPRWSHNLMIFALAIFIYSPMGVAAVIALLLAATVLLFLSLIHISEPTRPY